MMDFFLDELDHSLLLHCQRTCKLLVLSNLSTTHWLNPILRHLISLCNRRHWLSRHRASSIVLSNVWILLWVGRCTTCRRHVWRCVSLSSSNLWATPGCCLSWWQLSSSHHMNSTCCCSIWRYVLWSLRHLTLRHHCHLRLCRHSSRLIWLPIELHLVHNGLSSLIWHLHSVLGHHHALLHLRIGANSLLTLHLRVCHLLLRL